MIPALILDMRDETFSTRAELDALIRDKVDESRLTDGTCTLHKIVITPHQEKLLKLELAEQFVFRWKNLKQKRLDNIGNVPVVLAEADALLIPCPHCGDIHDSNQP